jgi:hypothetical protein
VDLSNFVGDRHSQVYARANGEAHLHACNLTRSFQSRDMRFAST